MVWAVPLCVQRALCPISPAGFGTLHMEIIQITYWNSLQFRSHQVHTSIFDLS